MSAKTISIINYKGGVGKTVSTFNIAFGFAFFNNFKVLVVDLDPQCSLSTICINAINYTNAHRYPNKPLIDISKIPAEQTINKVLLCSTNSFCSNSVLTMFVWGFQLPIIWKQSL